MNSQLQNFKTKMKIAESDSTKIERRRIKIALDFTNQIVEKGHVTNFKFFLTPSPISPFHPLIAYPLKMTINSTRPPSFASKTVLYLKVTRKLLDSLCPLSWV